MIIMQALLALMALMGITSALPLSEPTSNSVHCFPFGFSAPVDELYQSMYEFCAFTFPQARINQHTYVSEFFDLASGGTAAVWVDLDPVTPDWAMGDCLRLMVEVVTECQIDDQSSGGQYIPVGTGATTLAIQVTPPSNVTSNSIALSRLHSLQTRDAEAQCFVKAGMPEKPCVTWLLAAYTASDWCRAMNGRILNQGDDISMIFTCIVPHVFTSVHAYRSMSVFESVCQRALDPVLQTCTDDTRTRFYGGMWSDALANWEVDIRNDLTRRDANTIVVDAPFNATESTNSRFVTSCNSFPSGDNSVNIDAGTASSAADFVCGEYDGQVLLSKNDQAPLTLNTEPTLFSNVLTSDDIVLTSDDCHFAYDTLFKACTWDGLFYGGSVEVEPAKYTLEIPPAGLSPTRTLAARAVVPPTPSTINPTELAENQCFSELGYFAPQNYAMAAARLICTRLGSDDWDKGRLMSQPVFDGNTGQVLIYTIEAYIGSGMTPDFCFDTYERLINECSVLTTFFGGIKTYMGFYWTIKVGSKAAPEAIADAPTAPTLSLDSEEDESNIKTRDLMPRQLGTSDCDHRGASISLVRAYSAVTALCFDAGADHWGKGDGITHLYDGRPPWISARIVAQEPMDINIAKCVQTFSWLISSCDAGLEFCGGTLDANGARWSMEIVPAPDDQPRSDDTTNDLIARSSPYEDFATCPGISGLWVTSSQALDAAALFCLDVKDESIQAGYVFSNTVPEGVVGAHLQIRPDETSVIDYQSCFAMFSATILQCENKEQHIYGGYLQSGGLTTNMYVTTEERKPKAASLMPQHGSIQPRALSTRSPYDDIAGCYPITTLWVQVTQALDAATQHCRALDGLLMPANLNWVNLFAEGTVWVYLGLTPDRDITMNFQSCIEMFNSLVQQCQSGEQHIYGGQLYSDGLLAVTRIEESGPQTNNTAAQVDGSDARSIQTRSDDASNALVARNPYDARAGCFALTTLWVQWYQALNAAVQQCRAIDGRTIPGGFKFANVFAQGVVWVYAALTPSATRTVDYQSCIEMFDSTIRQCKNGEQHIYGGELQSDGLFANMYVLSEIGVRRFLANATGEKVGGLDALSLPVGSGEQSSDLVARDSDPAICYPITTHWVTKEQAQDAAMFHCTTMVGDTIDAGFEVVNMISEGMVWVYIETVHSATRVIDHQLCFDLVERIVDGCRNSEDHVYGGQVVVNGIETRFFVADHWGNPKQMYDELHGSDVQPRQNTGCIVAAATPIHKQVAALAVSEFCQQFGSQTIASNTAVSNTIEVEGVKIGMQVLATADEHYILYDQWCISGFMMLLTKCSAGPEDDTTKGGTMQMGDAAYSLSMAYV